MDSNLREMQLSLPATAEQLVELETALGVKLPEDYRDFLCTSNGAEGWCGEAYLALDPVEKVSEDTLFYRKEGFIPPGIVFIGGDGGGEAFFIDLREPRAEFINLPLIPMDFEYMRYCGNSFPEFLRWVAVDFLSEAPGKN